MSIIRDVPHLGGNTNISVEPVAGASGPAGFFILVGLEGGYVAEQLAGRSGASVHKVETLKQDEEYPLTLSALRMCWKAVGRMPKHRLFTPRAGCLWG